MHILQLFGLFLALTAAVRFHPFSETSPVFLHLKAHFGLQVFNVTGKLVVADPIQLCMDSPQQLPINAVLLKDAIVLAERGTCPFVQKAMAVSRSGGVALIVGDSTDNPLLIKMSHDPDADPIVLLPVVMVSKMDFDEMRSRLPAKVTVSSSGTDNGIEAFMDVYGIGASSEREFVELSAERWARINATKGHGVVIDVSRSTPDNYVR